MPANPADTPAARAPEPRDGTRPAEPREGTQPAEPRDGTQPAEPREGTDRPRPGGPSTSHLEAATPEPDGPVRRSRSVVRTPDSTVRTPPRAAVVVILLVVILSLTGTGRAFDLWPFATPDADVPLSSAGISVAPDGTRTPVPPGSDVQFLPGSRVAVLDPDDATPEQLDAAQESRDWLASGTVPGTGTRYEDMSVAALLDIRALTLDDGAVVAGWSANWRYAWPRDNAFVALALARTGHVDEALHVLAFLQKVQAPDGSFQARYVPDGSGPPDDRGVQTDATGWALWAAASVLAEIDDPTDRRAAALDLQPLVDRSLEHVLALTGDGTRLPPPSPDYWEVRTSQQTLGTSAPLLMALTAAPVALEALGTPARAEEVATVAQTFDTLVHDEFSPGYGRFLGGSSVDTAVAFLLPPFLPAPADGVPRDLLDAWHAAPAQMGRPGGGLAPGTSWKRDGISWTPTTSVFALASAGLASAGIDDADGAERWLSWLDDHRTTLGSIPEKVLADGAPAQLAPLGWSSANVLLALVLLDETTASDEGEDGTELTEVTEVTEVTDEKAERDERAETDPGAAGDARDQVDERHAD